MLVGEETMDLSSNKVNGRSFVEISRQWKSDSQEQTRAVSMENSEAEYDQYNFLSNTDMFFTDVGKVILGMVDGLDFNKADDWSKSIRFHFPKVLGPKGVSLLDPLSSPESA